MNLKVLKNYQNQLSTTKKDVLISPNPVKDVLQIENLNTEIDFSYEIHDISGKAVSLESVKENHRGIDVSKLKNGIYFLKILYVDSLTIIKFIKQ